MQCKFDQVVDAGRPGHNRLSKVKCKSVTWVSRFVSRDRRLTYDVKIELHLLYTSLGGTHEKHQKAYRVLFMDHIGDELMHNIREFPDHELVFG